MLTADPVVDAEVGHRPGIEQWGVSGACGDRRCVKPDGCEDAVLQLLLDNLPALVHLKAQNWNVLVKDNGRSGDGRFQFNLGC